ncbi:MAG: c-type cytochrome [Verrucomicrobiaceae bacterium]|nr:c-type cytochrome [Verrucomicrobiaceae bacterium]
MRVLALLLVLVLEVSVRADIPTPFNTEKTPGGPMPAAEAARTMELPPGFHCEVFAAEPDVQQPIALAWDARGRLWVAECYTYAENPDRWNLTMRDRILIFEDKDNDGHFDKRTVFWDQGQRLTSIEIGYGGVYALCAPNLYFIPDKNGDDVPDGQPEVLLDGFNFKTIGHNVVNGLKWGPDGWLYGRHGITDTSSIGAPGTPQEKRVKINCGMFRYHPTRHTFEVVLNGGTNSWGHDWDANGELFWINTVIGHIWHGIPGSYTERMFGTHLNSHVYEVLPMIGDHWHFDKGNEKWSDLRDKPMSGVTDGLGGGHAHVGCVIYNGGTWPDEYKGKIFMGNLHGHRINMDILERQGCGFVAKHGKDFMKAKDNWFRAIDLSTGPDGNVFVLDWSDAGECHDNDGIHRTSGRIYKIVYGEAKKMEPFDLTKASVAKVAEKLLESNTWWSTQATHELNIRGNSGKLLNTASDSDAHNKALWKMVELMEQSKTTPLATSYFTHSDPAMSDRLFDSKNEAFRTAFVDNAIETISWPLSSADVERVRDYLTGELAKRLSPGGSSLHTLELHSRRQIEQLEMLAKTDDSGLVRLHLASALQRLPLEARFPIATALASHAEDATDRDQPLMIWYGIEPAVTAHPDKAIALALSSKIPTVRRLITRRLAEEIEKTPGPVEQLLAAASKTDDSARADILLGMAAALKGFSQVSKPKTWDAFAASVASVASAKDALRDLSLVFGSGRAIDELIALIKEADGDANARRSAMDSLLRSPKPEQFGLVRGMINDKVLGTAARLGLAKFDNGDVPKALLNNWPDRSQEWRAANITTLSSRAAWAKQLLDYVAKHPTIAKEDITPYQARQIRNLNDEALTKQLTQVWGEARDTPEAKLQEIAKWKTSLTPDAIAKADAAKGRTLFAGVCASCHKMYGEGAALAPELTGSDRHNLDYLLGNIVDPNAVVPADYRVTVLKLKDGRTVTGVIPEQNDKVLTLQTPAERLTIQRSDITEQQQLTQSLMPEGLLTALGEENVKHLIAYLMSNGQVPLPK